MDGDLVGCLFEDGTETAVEIVTGWLKDGYTVHRVTSEWFKAHERNRHGCEPRPHAPQVVDAEAR